MELGRQYAAPVLCRAQHCGACAIAEENAGRAILPIQNATEGFCSDDQCVLRRSCPDHAFRHRKGIEEAGANGGDVKGDTIRDAKDRKSHTSELTYLMSTSYAVICL